MGSRPSGKKVHRTGSFNPGSVENDLDYIMSMFETIAHKARAGYANEGRGAMIVDFSTAPEVGGGYLSISRLLVELGTVPDKKLEQTLQDYNPVTEFVAVVRRSDRSLHGYVLRYSAETPE
jgi:hypothetical protein